MEVRQGLTHVFSTFPSYAVHFSDDRHRILGAAPSLDRFSNGVYAVAVDLDAVVESDITGWMSMGLPQQQRTDGVEFAGWQQWLHEDVHWRLAPAVAETLRRQLAAWYRSGGAEGPAVVLKQDRCREVTARQGLVLKKMIPHAGVLSRLRFAVRPSLSRRACRMALGLRAVGVPVVEPVAFGRKIRCGLTCAEMTVTVWLDRADALSVWLPRNPSRTDDVLRAYGALLGMFHRNGYANRDLKDENVLCLRDDPSSLWVADMDGVRDCRRISRFRAARDWRALVRSLAILGCADNASLAKVVQGYNAQVPSRLRWRRLPWFSEQARRLGDQKRAGSISLS